MIRNDIQALRGWAVIIVVLEHSGLNILPSGFLGVDIFFVISGFLITSHLKEGISGSTFTLADFYFKRARRILPAAYVTVIFTCIGAIWFLSPSEMISLRDQVIGAVGFFINFVFLDQADYFADDGRMKPLLHMWSLAVEEQFYIFLPLLMMFIPQHWWKVSVLAGLAASFIGCLIWIQYDATAAFYMLPSRAWELLIGSAGAIVLVQNPRARGMALKLFCPSVLILLVVPFLPFTFTHPGWHALAVCIATLNIILAFREGLQENLLVRGLARVGDISYSLYLTHWPVMAFIYAAYLGQPVFGAKIAAIVIGLILAIALYMFVEQPARKVARPSLRFVSTMALASALTVGTYFASAATVRTDIDFVAQRMPNRGFERICDFSGQALKDNIFIPPEECRNGPTPTTLVWGDSYAMHLIPGLAAHYAPTISQATSSICPPILGLAHDLETPHGDLVASRCLAFNDSVMAYLASRPEIDTVFLASPWRTHIWNRRPLWQQVDGKKKSVPASFELTFTELGKTISAIQKLGKTVVLFTPPPSLPQDMSACVEREISGKIILGREGCTIDKGKALKADAATYKLAEGLKQTLGIKVVHLSDALCPGDVCETVIDGQMIYRDTGHISVNGSAPVIKRLKEQGLLP